MASFDCDGTARAVFVCESQPYKTKRKHALIHHHYLADNCLIMLLSTQLRADVVSKRFLQTSRVRKHGPSNPVAACGAQSCAHHYYVELVATVVLTRLVLRGPATRNPPLEIEMVVCST